MAKRPIEDYPPVLDVEDIHLMLGIGRRQSYELCNSGEFHVMRIGKSMKIMKKSFLAWAEGTKQTLIQ